MTSSAITLPQPLTIRGLNHIPPPPVRDFEAEFGGLLPEGKSIPSSWGVIRYYDFNPTPDPHARRVILIHGGGTPAIGMAPLGFKLLQTGNHVVTYDLWGHGNSSTPLEAHVPALLHAQLFELLSYLGWSTAHILGFSMGATILATFGAIHFHVIESVTLVAGAGLTRRSDPWVANLKTAGDLGGELLDGQKIMDFVEGNPPLRDGWKDRLRQGQIDTEVCFSIILVYRAFRRLCHIETSSSALYLHGPGTACSEMGEGQP